MIVVKLWRDSANVLHISDADIEEGQVPEEWTLVGEIVLDLT